MAVGTAAAIGIAAGGALLGGGAGAMSKKSKSNSGMNLAEASSLENSAQNAQEVNYNQLQDILATGPNANDYTYGVQSQRDLAKMLGDYSKSGGLPTEQDISSANQISNNLFSSRQTALNQMFTDQNTEAERLAARLGRPVNDPILQAKLRTGFIRQQDLLNSEKMGASQNLALQLPGQRLGYAQAQAGLMDAIGQQAVSNRNYLIGLGSQLSAGERNFRIQTAERWGKQSSGGGLGGALTGIVGGAGAGLSAAGSFMGAQASMDLMGAQSAYYKGLTPSSGGFGGGFSMPSFASSPQTQFGLGSYSFGSAPSAPSPLSGFGFSK